MRRLLLAVAPYFVVISLLVLLGTTSLEVLSAARAYVGGEGLWSKAQKDAVRALEHYAYSADEADFADFRTAIAVPLGDREARLEMQKAEPDIARVTAGFIAGGNDPDDVSGLIMLFRHFRSLSFMAHSIAIWTEGDRYVDEIISAADELHAVLRDVAPRDARDTHPGAPADPRVVGVLQRLHEADAAVSPLEREFSATLGAASRRARVVFQAGVIAFGVILLAIAVRLSSWMLAQNVATERALRTSRERLDMAVRGSNDGIWNWSAGDGEIWLSPRAAELVNAPPGEVLRDPTALLAFVHSDDRDGVAAAVHDMIAAQGPLDVEFRLSDAGGAHRWIQVRGRPLELADGGITRMAGSITDINERRRADEARRQLAREAQRRSEQAQIALLEQVQGRMGRELHDDLGQQLTGVAFLAKALEQRLSTESPTERDQTSWIVKLINSAIDRVRFMSRQLSPISIDEVSLGMALQRLADDVHAIFGTQVTLRMSEDEARISGQHANQFFRIAQESISNALRHGQATQIRVSLDAWENVARLAVCDNGVGFRFRSIDQNRSLGLRSMAIRAEQLQGRLRIRSTVRGTTLIVRSPDCARLSPRRPERIS